MGEFITRYEGRCWKFGANIPTDALVKSQYVFEPMDEIVKHVLEDHNPRFPLEVQRGDIVVAGFHFGQSSGRAIAAKALQATGIGCVVSDAFSRTFFRNAFEIGLPLLEVSGATEIVATGDRVIVDVAEGIFRNETSGAELCVPPPPQFLLRMLAAGGLIALTQDDADWERTGVDASAATRG